MKFIDLNGKEHSKNVDRYRFGKRQVSKSKGQMLLGDKILQLFPNITLFEEFPCFGTRLKLDYFLPALKIAFEFDGKQHREYNPFFHGDRTNFARAQLNDVKKEEWCIINGIILIRITEDEMEDFQRIVYERTREQD